MSNESNNWEIYSGISDENEEREAARLFEHDGITVENLSVDLLDDFNGEVGIELSNGDVIYYCLSEKRGDGGPDYDFFIEVNGQFLTEDLGEVLNYGTTTIVGDVLSWYCNNYANR